MIIVPEVQELLDKLEKRSTELEEHNAALERENKILREELALFRQHMFGRRSERIEAGQLGLFSHEGLEEAAAEAAATPRAGSR